jgi:hypothetical protein
MWLVLVTIQLLLLLLQQRGAGQPRQLLPLLAGHLLWAPERTWSRAIPGAVGLDIHVLLLLLLLL